MSGSPAEEGGNTLVVFEVADCGVVAVLVHVEHLLRRGDRADVEDNPNGVYALGK